MIPGLKYVPNYLSVEDQESFINIINDQPWLTDLKRRVQHYGYKYDYRLRSVSKSMFIGSLPEWLQKLADKLFEDKYLKVLPDQVIINEYLPGQGIANHVDCGPCFTDTIATISLGSNCIIEFTKVEKNLSGILEYHLAPRSLLIITDKARYNWTHGIVGRKTDLINGLKVERQTRFSITFRKVIL